MRALRVALVGAVACFALLALPTTAFGFAVQDTTGGPVQNAYGLWYSGSSKCAAPACHKSIADVETVHSGMVKDVSANPGLLTPGTTHWPAPNGGGAVDIGASDVYLQLGDRLGFLEYVGFAQSPKSPALKPGDDLPLWDPVEWLIQESEWAPAGSGIGARSYVQSCAPCHNVGVTRPSNEATQLANGGSITTGTASAVSELSIGCEVCHGSGGDPNEYSHHEAPKVVGGLEVLKAQVCGQCHVSGTAISKAGNPVKNVANAAYSNPNGYTPDEPLSSYFTAFGLPGSWVDTAQASGINSTVAEAEFQAFLAGTGPKPKFLPNGANYSMRHSYYNEWLLNGVPSGSGGQHGHVSPINSSVAKSSDAKCLGCHSGIGFLRRIRALDPKNEAIIVTTPTVSYALAKDVGITCQVCHNGHVRPDNVYGGYESLRTWGNGKQVDCADCHNWQFEVLEQPLQSETIDGDLLGRPAANTRVRHPQREMLKGGFGGDSQNAGMWGVGPMGTEMGSTTCADCHMPRTAKEGGILPSNSNDDGSPEATRMSHRFHPVLPGDAERWSLRKNGDSCVAECHEDEASDWSRDEFQTWIDDVQAAVSARSDEVTSALGSIATEYGLKSWSNLIAVRPSAPATASAILPAEWAMLQHAAQNADFVLNDASKGVHNSSYAEAGLDKAAFWARSFRPGSFVLSVPGGYRDGDSGVEVTGSLTRHGSTDAVIPDARVTLQASTDGGASWETRGSADASATSFGIASGALSGDTLLRFAFAPSEGVSYFSNAVTVSVPRTTITLVPVSASMGWLNTASVGVTLDAVPVGSITSYSLSGAQISPFGMYAGPFSVIAEGATTISYRSVDANGAEALQSVVVRIDRTKPTVTSDAKAGYATQATIKLTGADVVSPVGSTQWRLDSGSWVTQAGAVAGVSTSALGRHTLEARAIDSAGNVSDTKTWTFSVKATPTLIKNPNVSGATKRLYQTQRFGVSVKRGTVAVGGKYVYLERSTNSGKTWSRVASVKTRTSDGYAYKDVKFYGRGYTYWRWTFPGDASYNLARSGVTKVTVR